MNEGTGANEDAKGADQVIDQDLIDARIDNTFQILDSAMRECGDYLKIKDLQNYKDLQDTAENIIDEKWSMFRGAMITMTKEKNELIKNCE